MACGKGDKPPECVGGAAMGASYCTCDRPSRIAELETALRNILYEAERENGSWAHLKRTIAVNARRAITKDKSHG